MAFSFGGGFGQSQAASSPFGSTPASPFGQPAGGFGQASSPFGSTASTPAFGAASAPAFGAGSTPAFGSTATPAFGGGGGAFGAKPATGFGGFGAASTPSLFGAASQPAFGASNAFGASSAPAFGAAPATPAFGASSPFGSSTPAFGAAGAPAFGAASTPAFGATSAPLFGASGSPGAFGSAPSFGAAPAFGGGGAFGGGAAATGTRQVPYAKTTDQDQTTTGAGGTKQTVHLNSISAMKQYEGKSPEELRWEDYSAGVKGGTGQQPASGGFGKPSQGFGASPGSPFGAPATSSPGGFGAGGFGASQPAFGQAQQSSPAFGGAFGSTAPAFGSSQPAFGAPASSTGGGLFGSTSTAPFGSTSIGVGGGFGVSAPAFGAAASTPAFGATAASAPAFGATSTFGSSFGAASSAAASGGFGFSAPAFGATGGSLFGGSTPAMAFGSTASTPAFGATSTPAFSFAQSSPAFGATATGAFGASTPAFGGASTPAFGGGGGLFGGTAQKSGGLFAPSSTSFGTPGAFGTPPSAFPAASTPGGLFGGGGSIFSSPGASNFALNPAQPQQAQAGPAPGVATTPYGTLPAAPQVGGGEAFPEHRVGLTQRPLGPMVGRSVMRPTALLTPRSITPRAGVRLRTPRPRSISRAAGTDGEHDGAAGAGANGDGAHGSDLPDPRRLFVRAPLPSTAAAGESTASPATGEAAGGGGSARRRSRDERAPKIQPAPDRTRSSGGGGDGERSPQREGGGRRSGEAARPDERQTGDGGGQDDGFDQEQRPETGNGGGAARHQRSTDLGDDEVGELLPRLEPGSDYFLQPSLTQLAAMAREEPDSLAHVANFTVGRPGVGSVRWLEEVDVRGVDVEDLVRLSRGGVEVYLDDASKPPVGHGLNCAARITLLKVHKMDEATKKPTTDPAAIDCFTTKLKKLAARQGATFVSYNAERGEWRFDVEHFSRYGLIDEDSEEEETEAAAKGGSRAAAAAPLPPADEQGSDAMQEGDEDEGLEMVDGGNLEEEAAAADGTQQHAQPARRAGARRPLSVALPASLGLEAARLSSIRNSLFEDLSARPLQGRRGGQQDFGEAVGASAPAPAAPAPNAWRQAKPAIEPPHPPAVQALPQPRSLTPPLALPPPSPGAVTPSAQPQPEASRSLVDMGLLLGQSSRVGWAPSGVFAQISRNSSGQRIVLRRLDVTARLQGQGGAAAAADRARGFWRDALEVHAAQSSPDLPVTGIAAADGAGAAGDAAAEAQQSLAVPRWRLKCSREQQLQRLCLRFTTLCTDYLTQNALQQGLERTCYHHEAWTWDLLRVLFETLPGDEQTPDGQPGSMLESGHAEHEQEATDPNSASSLAAFQRRGGLSHWLQDFAQVHLAARLRGGARGTDAVLAALSGHQLGAAMTLAAAAGDVRLATLLSQAGKRGAGTADAAAQLHTWQEAGMEAHIDERRLHVYRVLGGELGAVVPSLQLPWRLALGMHLWYGQGGSTGIQAALDSFDAASRAGAAPPPAPLHTERHAGGNGATDADADGNTTDVDLQLLRLYAGRTAADGEDLAALLAPGGYTREPLDARLGWLLAGVLSAIDALPPTADNLPQVAMVTAAVVAQLEAVDLHEWAVYAALHLPDDLQRGRAVHELLTRHAPQWAADAGAREFLVSRLRIPAARLSDALALWAQAQRATGERLAHLAASGPAQLAQSRAIAAAETAPQLLVARRLGDLRALLARLRAGEPQTAGPLAPYAAYLRMQDAGSGGAAGDMQQEAAWLGQLLQSQTPAAAAGSVTNAALSIITATFVEWSHSVGPDADGAAAAEWHALPLRQADLLDEMQLASAALAEAISVACRLKGLERSS